MFTWRIGCQRVRTFGVAKKPPTLTGSSCERLLRYDESEVGAMCSSPQPMGTVAAKPRRSLASVFPLWIITRLLSSGLRLLRAKTNKANQAERTALSVFIRGRATRDLFSGVCARGCQTLAFYAG